MLTITAVTPAAARTSTWPGDGTALDFKAVDAHAALKTKPIGMLEIAYDLTPNNDEIIRRGTRAAEIMSGL